MVVVYHNHLIAYFLVLIKSIGGKFMLHELLGGNKIKIEECGISFEEMYDKPYFPKEYEEEIKKSNFLMIPEEGFRGYEEVLFPEETLKFYSYVKEHAKEDIYPEICISDDDYKELELHADVSNIVEVIVTMIALPFAINMISSYVYDKVKSRKADLDVKVKTFACNFSPSFSSSVSIK